MKRLKLFIDKRWVREATKILSYNVENNFNLMRMVEGESNLERGYNSTGGLDNWMFRTNKLPTYIFKLIKHYIVTMPK